MLSQERAYWDLVHRVLQEITFANEYIALNKERDETIMTAVRANGHRPNVQAFWDPKDET